MEENRKGAHGKIHNENCGVGGTFWSLLKNKTILFFKEEKQNMGTHKKTLEKNLNNMYILIVHYKCDCVR